MSVIYRLTDSEGRFYIGSTTNLHLRLKKHKNKTGENSSRSKQLCDDWTCDILEYCELYGNDLRWLERKYYEEHKGNPKFVNRNVPIRTEEEIEQRHILERDERLKRKKEYHLKNREKVLQRAKEYRERNREELRKKAKIYEEQNGDKKRAYHHQNKDRINARKREKIKCECGAVISRSGIVPHKRSKKHLSFVNS